jgi:hypothetical protein
MPVVVVLPAFAGLPRLRLPPLGRPLLLLEINLLIVVPLIFLVQLIVILVLVERAVVPATEEVLDRIGEDIVVQNGAKL